MLPLSSRAESDKEGPGVIGVLAVHASVASARAAPIFGHESEVRREVDVREQTRRRVEVETWALQRAV